MTTQPTQPAAGWYPDPQMPQTLRFWDGATWTDHVAPNQSAPAPAPYAYGGQPRAESMTVGYILAVLLPIVGLIYGLAKWRVGGPPVVVASVAAWVVWTLLFFG